MNKRRFGQFGEKIAETFLKRKSYKILEKNYYIQGGEIDLIAEKDEMIAFVEVKTRRANEYGEAIESLTDAKLNSLVEAAEQWLFENNIEDQDWRIDFIGINMRRGKVVDIEHVENIELD